MWNPETYVDTDYGLDEGESFEPDDAWEPEPFDTSQPHVMTVLGPVSPADLGITQAFERIQIPIANASTPEPAWLAELGAFRDELEFFVTAGGGTLVDGSTPDSGRNLDVLVTLAQLVPANLIASAGRGPDRADSTMPGAGDEELLYAELMGDLQADIKPGLLTFAIGEHGGTAVEWANMRAAARVAVETGYPLRVGLDSFASAGRLLDDLEQAGVDLKRLIVGQIDAGWSLDTLTAIGHRGAYLAFDRVGQGSADLDRERARLIVQLAEAGLADRLLVSQGLAGPGQFISHGGAPGWIHLIERFTLTLMDAGADALLVRNVLIDNPEQALTIHPPGADGEHAPL